MKNKMLVLVFLLVLLSQSVSARVRDICVGTLIQDRVPAYVGDDNHDMPVHLVVFYSQDYDHFATLFAISEYPEGSGEYYYFQPAGATVRHNQSETMEWSGVTVTINACGPNEVRYQVAQDNQPDA